MEDRLPNQGDGEISSTASSPPFCSLIFVEQEDYSTTDISYLFLLIIISFPLPLPFWQGGEGVETGHFTTHSRQLGRTFSKIHIRFLFPSCQRESSCKKTGTGWRSGPNPISAPALTPMHSQHDHTRWRSSCAISGQISPNHLPVYCYQRAILWPYAIRSKYLY